MERWCPHEMPSALQYGYKLLCIHGFCKLYGSIIIFKSIYKNCRHHKYFSTLTQFFVFDRSHKSIGYEKMFSLKLKTRVKLLINNKLFIAPLSILLDHFPKIRVSSVCPAWPITGLVKKTLFLFISNAQCTFVTIRASVRTRKSLVDCYIYGYVNTPIINVYIILYWLCLRLVLHVLGLTRQRISSRLFGLRLYFALWRMFFFFFFFILFLFNTPQELRFFLPRKRYARGLPTESTTRVFQ